MTSGGEDAPVLENVKRGRKPNASYAAAAQLALQYHLGGMTVLAASRTAIDCLAAFGDIDLRGLVPGARGLLPNDGLHPSRELVKQGNSMRSLSEFTSRPQRPAKWDDPENPTLPRYYLACDDTVVQQVAALVRKLKKRLAQD